jgi:hypothetical protein
MEPDFSGWATKANLKCSDGRTITSDAFKHMDGQKVPLMWQHGHASAENVLGYGILTHKGEGMRLDGYFNSTKSGKNAQELVEHGDIKALSIYANGLIEKNKLVMHGDIREASLVLAGANRGAVIDNVNIRHADGDVEELDDEVIIFTGLEFFHAEDTDGDGGASGQGDDVQGDATNKTLQQVWDEFTPEQQDVVNYMVGEAVESSKNGDEGDPTGSETDAEHSDDNKTGEGDLSHQEGSDKVTRNVFDQTDKDKDVKTGRVLTHAEMGEIFEAAKKGGGRNSLKEVFEEFCLAHSITPMDVLFPNFKNLDNVPTFNSRRMEWVQGVLNGVSHTPFSRVRSIVADITMDEARAKGYITGSLKKEEWFSVSRRTTSPTTVYKKQKLDRDDIIDITDFDIVAWMKGEMDIMLKEEIARAILLGDGRAVDDDDKIKDPAAATDGIGIRSIINEHELYKTDVNVNLTATPVWRLVVEQIMAAMRFYKGTGTPVFYTTLPVLTSMLLEKDTLNRRLYNSKADLAAAMMVSDIVTVEAMESNATLLGIVVNLTDYNVGADKGGEMNLFDFFDIDYNQYKYLAETRISGALTRVKSALAIWSVPSADIAVTPTAPTFDDATGVVTVVATTHVVYKDGTGATLTAGAQTALTGSETLTVVATPAAGYYFPISGNPTQWTFELPQ